MIALTLPLVVLAYHDWSVLSCAAAYGAHLQDCHDVPASFCLEPSVTAPPPSPSPPTGRRQLLFAPIPKGAPAREIRSKGAGETTVAHCCCSAPPEWPMHRRSPTEVQCTDPDFKMDAYCDDDNNTPECDYDGGDCCGVGVNTEYCDECECRDPQPITSHIRGPLETDVCPAGYGHLMTAAACEAAATVLGADFGGVVSLRDYPKLCHYLAIAIDWGGGVRQELGVFFNNHTGAATEDAQPICAALVTQTIQLNAGWTWFSLNVVAEDMSVQALLPDFPDGTNLKSQNSGFADFYEGYGWYGQLTTLDTTTMYKIRLTEPHTLTVEGIPVQLPMPLTFAGDRPWLSYPLQSPATVADALQYNAQPGDQLKSQQAFTEYWGPDNGWFGTLTTLEPGQGYTLKAACAADGSCGNPRWVDVA